ncbi:MAG: hypothetical protein COB36_10690 [Alphaproteobacteria bacterium]|nr:MAG: hypothetical protein COB36_10690 [Alphaproteobacteria bacterium]
MTMKLTAKPMALNDDILDAEVRHAIYLQRYGGGVSNRILALLNRTEADVIQKMARLEGITDFKSKRFNTLLDSIRATRKKAYTEAGESLKDEAVDLAQYEAGFQVALLNKTIPIQWNVVLPSKELLRAAVTSRPFQGRLLKEWVKGMEAREFVLLKDQLRIGMVEGETLPQIIRRVRGTKALNYVDGLFGKSRREVDALVRTAVNHVHNAARNEVGIANRDLIKGVEWVSTLDGRTTAICRARDNNVYPVDSGPRPPAHIRCRSTVTFVTKSWKELGINLQEAPAGTRASMNGQVPDNLSYGGWLRKQPRSFVTETLGSRKAKLFLDGNLKIDKFVDRRGNTLNLDQLKIKESAAWDKAGL